jgi:CBS domain-containing protein
MSREGADAVVILGPSGEPAGIVTDRDLRERVLAAGRSPDEPTGAIMTSPLVTISAEAPVLEAVLEMTRHGIHHLGVAEAGRLVGVLSGQALVHLHATAPVGLVRLIRAGRTVGDLAPAVPMLIQIIRRLDAQGLPASSIGRIIAELNDHLVRRVLALAEEELGAAGRGAPPVDYCWLALGSEGRAEQTIRTDQDNALVYADPPAALRSPAAEYFGALAERVIAGLLELGYPRCPAGFMASNVRWCQPLEAWRAYVGEWIGQPLEDQHLLYACTCLDFRAVAGSAPLAAALRQEVAAQVKAWRSFPRHLAKVAVSHAPPLGLFGRFLLERQDGRLGIDVKLNGMLPLVNALRVYALDVGAAETNSLERLVAAARAGFFGDDEVEEIREAYETLFSLRLRHQLARVGAGQVPDNFLDPRGLARGEQRRLKEAFRAIRRLQGKVEVRYFTEPL